MMNSHPDFAAPRAAVPRLTEDIQALARHLRHHVPNLTVQERQFLKDQERREGHSLRSLERMAEIASRSPDPADREALGDTFRRRARRRERELAGVSLCGIEDEEFAIEAEENLAQREHSKRPADPSVRARLAAALRRRLNVTTRFLEAL
jgi:hypothetical protein